MATKNRQLISTKFKVVFRRSRGGVEEMVVTAATQKDARDHVKDFYPSATIISVTEGK